MAAFIVLQLIYAIISMHYFNAFDGFFTDCLYSLFLFFVVNSIPNFVTQR